MKSRCFYSISILEASSCISTIELEPDEKTQDNQLFSMIKALFSHGFQFRCKHVPSFSDHLLHAFSEPCTMTEELKHKPTSSQQCLSPSFFFPSVHCSQWPIVKHQLHMIGLEVSRCDLWMVDKSPAKVLLAREELEDFWVQFYELDPGFWGQ